MISLKEDIDLFAISGQYSVIMDESHFKDLLNQHVTPPPATVSCPSFDLQCVVLYTALAL